jgi:predicted dehydrogenase
VPGAAAKKLKVGAIGCGLIVQTQHLPLLLSHPRVEVVCVCDRDRYRRERAASSSGAVPLVTPEQVLSFDAVDAVLIATHDLLHAELVQAALLAGKHVFVEKPLALGAAAAESILELARAVDGLVVAVGLQRLHDPSLRRIASLLGAVGDIGLVHMHDFCHDNSLVLCEGFPELLSDPSFLAGQTDFGERERWEALANRIFAGCPADALLDTYRLILNLACHDLSVLVRLFGEPDAVELADFWPAHFGVVAYRFGGIRCILELGQTRRKWFDERLRIVGTDGTLEASWATPFIPGIPTEVQLRHLADGTDTTVYERFTHESLFRLELWDFVERALRGDGRDDSLENAVAVTRWLEKAIQRHIDCSADAMGRSAGSDAGAAV